jgi:hypothetical protein
MYREYDESLHVISEMQQAGTSIFKLDDMEFGRRLAVEKELEKSQYARFVNAGKYDTHTIVWHSFNTYFSINSI